MKKNWQSRLMENISSLDSNLPFSLMNRERWEFVCEKILSPYAKFSQPYITYNQISQRDGNRCWEFCDSNTTTLTEPSYFIGLPDEIENKLGSFSFEAPYVLEAEDVVLNSSTGLLSKKDKYLLFDYHSRDRDVLDLVYSYRIRDQLMDGKAPNLSPTRGQYSKITEPAVPLIDTFVSNYTHWTQEFLILLEGVCAYEDITGIKPLIIIQDRCPDYVVESLQLLGFENDRIKTIDESNILLTQAVLTSKRRHHSSEIDGLFMRDTRPFSWLRQRARRKITDQTTGDYSSRIIISREDASRRRVTNQTEVYAALEKLGFKKYILSQLSYRRQVELFSQAEFIIGAHGSGLINGIYAEDANVIEMYAERYTAAIYEIFQGIGHEYACLSCNSRGKDLEVNIEELVRLVQDMSA